IEEAIEITNEPEHATGPYDHRAELSRYKFPPIDLLEDRPSGAVIDMAEQQANKERIEKTLLDYKIPISRIEATVGPTVTLYEIVPAEGIRISQIKRLEDDIALSLSALGIRIIAPIPGKGTVGIEVPNKDPQTVSMRAVISSRKFQETKAALPMAMGATISNDIFIADMAKMPHLLVAGATGMGKSVGLNAIITSLIYKKHPSELKFVLVDPKMVEFSLYSKLERHYLAKLPNEEDAIITDMGKVIQTLNSLCVEMDNRYELLRNANVRSLEEYNRKFTERKLNPNDGHKYLPYIVVVVDEFADLIMTQGKEVETPISRIAQKARAVGMHMILATQRPSTNVITGLIKANFPGRIAFRVIQMVDSRTILDCPGANQLIGRGDMLFSHNGSMERVQCAFISTEEVEAITEYIDNQIGYEHAYYLPEYVPEEAEGGVISGASMERDSLFDEAARFVVSRQMGSTSSLQRQFGIGYNRAGKLMDQMEAAGIVGGVNVAKPRAILVDMMSLEAILGQG
ncbi:MAG: DNA translocase FtsK, partial [Muribaculaceae bacterium]|nr:DNA translocase FtsK [Muribaculaceae bacterium]